MRLLGHPLFRILSWCFCLSLFVFFPAKVHLETISPLHVEGRFLKDSSGKTVVLRGVNHHGFLDVPDGAWDAPGAPLYSGMGKWDPEVVKGTLDDYRKHGFNVARFHTIVDWWKRNPQTYKDPYRDVTYPATYRQMMENTIQWAGERGLYVIFDFYALQNLDGRQSGQESLPWPPWGRFPKVVASRAEYVSIWDSVASVLGRYPNVLFELYNEPHGDEATEEEWFKFVGEVLPVLRTHTQNPVIVQWDYMCWVNLDYPPPQYSASTLAWIEKYPLKDSNIVYGTHLYRNSGNGGPGSAHRTTGGLVNLWEKADVDKALTFVLLPDSINRLQKPLLVTEIGAFLTHGGDDKDREIHFFKNSLSFLNQWGIGYVGWAWGSDQQLGHGMLHDGEPNEAGKIFLDSLKAKPGLK